MAQGQLPPQSSLAERGATARPKRILIVEDEAIIALDLRGALEELGYQVVGTAASGKDAIRLVALSSPDLVLMDIRLDGPIDGIEAAAQLRTRHDLPIVYLSANADTETIRRALETLPGGYLAKPYNYRSLRTTIEVALRKHEAELVLRHEGELLAQQKTELEQKASELTELAQRLHRDSTIDALTGLYNRRHFDAALVRELSLAERSGRAVGLIFLDFDHFKRINDTFGHAAGDDVLRGAADLLRSRLRPYDIPCRYGGEEMAIVVPGAWLSDVAALAERLRVGIEELNLVDQDNRPIAHVTASFGVSAYPEIETQAEKLVRSADAALYRAKADGRNGVALARASLGN